MGQTITTTLKILGDIQDFQGKLNELQNGLNKVALKTNVAEGFASEFATIKQQLDKLAVEASKKEITLGDKKRIEKQVDSIEKQYLDLFNRIERESQKNNFLKKDAQLINSLKKVQDEYTKSIEKTTNQEKALNKELEKAEKKQKDFEQARKKQIVDDKKATSTRAAASSAKKAATAANKALEQAQLNMQERIAKSKGKYEDENSLGFKNTKEYQEYKVALEQALVAQEKLNKAQEEAKKYVTQDERAKEEQKVAQGIQSARESLLQYQSTQKKVANDGSLEKLKNDILQIKNVDWDAYGIDPSTIQSAEDLENALAKIGAQAGVNAAEALQEIKNTASEASNPIRKMNESVTQSGNELDNLSRKAENTSTILSRIQSIIGAAGAMRIFSSAIRSAVSTIKELDAQMTAMSVVTSQSVSDYWSQLPEYTKRANALGVSIKSAYEAATLYYQQGLKTNEVVAVSNETLKMARIAGLNAEDATNKMTAALRGFNMEVNQVNAQNIADVYSKLAAITASNVEEISTAMTKTASLASNAGMQFETTAAFLAQIINITVTCNRNVA